MSTPLPLDDDEIEPLLSAPPPPNRFARWRKASPYWIILVVLISNLCRGMTMAPRIEVYTQLACRALHEGESDAPSSWPSSPLPNSTFTNTPVMFADIYPTRDVTILTFAGSSQMNAFDECSADPKVQGRAARIHASVKTTESVLSAITTGYLSHLGDRHGRKPILSLAVFGALFMDAMYLLVSNTDTIFSRHGEGFIIAAPFIEGLLGAHPTYSGVTHAYATDLTVDGSRARIFVMMQGTLYAGLALGPWLSGAVLGIVSNRTMSTLSPFALAVVIALCNLALVVFVLPESLPPNRRLHVHASHSHSHPKNFGSMLKQTFLVVSTQLLRPIALFYPIPLDCGRKGRNWNFTLTGMALFIYVLSLQILGLRYLYAKHVFGWTSEQLGYYMSLLWTTRAITLLIVLPALLSYFTPGRSRSSSHSPAIQSPAHLASALRYDRLLASFSFLTDATLNLLVTLVPASSQIFFVLITALNSGTAGGYPALQSLGAVAMQAMGRRDELGLVFGALGVVNAVGYTVAPAIYAAIYGATVAEFPRAIFVLTAALLYVAVALLFGVRPHIDTHASEDDESQAMSVYGDDDGESEEAPRREAGGSEAASVRPMET